MNCSQAQDHFSAYIEGFIETLELSNITLVVHDWGSGLGLHYARRMLRDDVLRALERGAQRYEVLVQLADEQHISYTPPFCSQLGQRQLLIVEPE